MSDAGDEARDEVRHRVNRRKPDGRGWAQLDQDTQRKLKRWAEAYAEDSDDPDEAARSAIRKAQRQGLLGS
jgi:hypothetical protein